MKPKICFKKATSLLTVLWLTTSLAAQTKITNSVFGSGGTPTTGSSNSVVGTVGQPAIGQTASPASGVRSGFWAQAVDIVTEVEQQSSERIPDKFQLEQNYPNPFNPTTTIGYDLPAQADVRLTIFDLLGRTVRTLVEQKQPAGAHSVVWNGRDDRGRQLASGLYFYRLEAGNFRKTAKMVLLK